MEKIKNQRNVENSKRIALSISIAVLSSVVLSGCSNILYGYNFNMPQHDNDSTSYVVYGYNFNMSQHDNDSTPNKNCCNCLENECINYYDNGCEHDFMRLEDPYHLDEIYQEFNFVCTKCGEIRHISNHSNNDCDCKENNLGR